MLYFGIDKDADVLYRYESYNVGFGVDQFDDPIPGHTVKVTLLKLKVLRRTPKGAWIESCARHNGRRFVLLTARKQYASNTIEKAKECFIHRKKRYITILNAKLEDAKSALRLIENGLINV